MQKNNLNLTDESVNKNIKTQLSADKTVSDLNIKTNVKDGVVTVSGNVNTDDEAAKAVEIIEATPGVKDTNISQLTVQESKQPLTDTIITAKVKGIYIREKLLGDADVVVFPVSVETRNGVVYLTGEVETKDQAMNAVKLVKNISGVKSVESKIEVKPKENNN